MVKFMRGIKGKLLLSYIAIMVPLMLVILYSHYDHFLEKRADIMTARVAFARNVASNFEHFIQEVTITERAAGLAISENSYTRREASDYLGKIATRYPFFDLNYVRVDGHIFASSDPSLVGALATEGGFDPAYYKANLRSGKDWLVSPLHLHRDNDPSIDIVTGIWRGSKLTGIVVASVNTTRLGETLVFEVPGGGYNITDSKGKLVYQNQHPDTPIERRNWSGYQFIKTASAGHDFTSFGLTFPIDSSYRMGAQVPIRSLGWSAGSFVPVDEVLSAIRMDLITSSVVAVVVLILALVLALIIGRFVVNPLLLLARKSTVIAGGNFDEEIDVFKTRDEIGELSRSFNAMRLNLRDYVTELNGLVETGEKMNLALNIPFVETAVTSALRNYFDAKIVWIALYDEHERVVKIDHFWSEYLDDSGNAPLPSGRAMTTGSLMSGKPLIIRDVEKANFAFKELALAHGLDSLISLPMVSGGGVLGVIEFNTPLIEQNRITEKEMGLLMALANQAAVAIENARLYEETRQSERKLRASNDDLRILNKLALDISSGLDLRSLLEKTVNNAIDLVSADICTILVYDKTTLKIEHEFRTASQVISRYDGRELGMAETVVKIQRPVYTNDYRHDPRVLKEAVSLGINAVAATPLLVGNRLIGVLEVGLIGDKEFSTNDIALLEAVGRQAAIAIENARLYEKEREVSETLQNALLAIPDELAGIKLGLLYRSAADNSKVGGDFYDFVEFTDGKIGVVVGDVSGKGLEAAAATALAKMTIRAFAYEYKSPADVLEHGNAVIGSQLPVGQFITMIYVVIDPATGEFTYATAGHPSPLVVNREKQSVRQLRIGATPLGVVERVLYGNYQDVLLDGEVLLLYTDGLIEARTEDELFGDERVGQALLATGDLDVAEIPGKLYDAAQQFSEGQLSDDIAIIALSLDAGRVAKPELGEVRPIRPVEDLEIQ